ncbi:MAG: stage III sporulation protein AE [Firmicutes bacterium]|nr:stage III sporulation protein AE [Bacillota bacterium]
MKRWLIFLFISMAIMIFGGNAVGAAPSLPAEVIDAVDLSELKTFLNTVDEDVQRYLPRLDLKSWGLTGPKWDFSRIGKGLIRFFLREVIFNYRLLVQLLIVAMALAILENLRHAFEEDNTGRLAFSVCFLVVMGIVVNCFRITFSVAKGAVTEMTGFMYAITPILFSIVAAGGGVTTAAIVHPLLISSVGVIGGLVSNLVFPLIMFAGILGMANHLTEGFQVNKLARFFKLASVGILGVMMAIFIGLVTIRGFTASVADSLTLRAAKYLTSTFLPVVGGALSDTVEMSAGCAAVLKSGLGVYGLGLITLVTVFPLLKILAVALIFQMTGIITQPLGNNRLSDALQTVSDVFFHLFGAVTVVGLMFYIALAILVGAANFGLR